MQNDKHPTAPLDCGHCLDHEAMRVLADFGRVADYRAKLVQESARLRGQLEALVAGRIPRRTSCSGCCYSLTPPAAGEAPGCDPPRAL